MLLLGIDVGTSSIKVSVVDAEKGTAIASAQFPDTEAPILSLHTGWAEQDPESWWQYTVQGIQRLNASGKFSPENIGAIGIAYQMHGLVAVDKNKKVLRPSIIWCDSRAVAIGDKAFEDIGEEYALSHFLNSPGNFTASKLAWVKKNEPEIFGSIYKIMLPGDYIAMQLTGEITTSPSALSEGIFWDFSNDGVASRVMEYYGFSNDIIPAIQPVFSSHGVVNKQTAALTGLPEGIPVAYKAGDQPNNALSLNVLQPGEVAATAGTSGVIYAVSDQLTFDRASRVNSFAHVNHSAAGKSIGVLLCINGTGIMNRWIRDTAGAGLSYGEINNKASGVPLGSEGLTILPFGNGAERMLGNKMPGALIQNLQFNTHTPSHLFRAVQEGIACSFRYGLDILRENNLQPAVIRAGKANMFLSELFTELFVNFTGAPVELYQNDGSAGAAVGAGIGAGIYTSAKEAFRSYQPVGYAEPKKDRAEFEDIYGNWKNLLNQTLQ
ncbi:MAG: carbohydrate kinase [Chitinophagaceae bacterium]|nr:carbohydrate kinase [Chitinophagaceae bacterium]MCW5928426.1 carbohydrate kinase [Chitinophagaceae bacterium]